MSPEELRAFLDWQAERLDWEGELAQGSRRRAAAARFKVIVAASVAALASLCMVLVAVFTLP